MERKLTIILVGIILLFSGYRFYISLTDKVLYISDHQERHQYLIPPSPKDLYFAGEKVHFQGPDAYFKYYKELKLNTTKNKSTRLLLKNVRIWLPQIEDVLVGNKIPKDFKYLAVAESNLNNVVSPKGASGFWQLKQETAIELGLEVNDEVDERNHPRKATKAACKYFKQAYKIFGNWTSAAAAYNRGIYGLLRAYDEQDVKTYYELKLNHETSRYLYKILACKDLIDNPSKYNMRIIKFKKPHLMTIKVDTSIRDLHHFANRLNVDYEVFKEYNPWLLKNTLTIKEPGKSYFIIVPLFSQPQKALNSDTSRIRPSPKDLKKIDQAMNGFSLNKNPSFKEDYIYF